MVARSFSLAARSADLGRRIAETTRQIDQAIAAARRLEPVPDVQDEHSIPTICPCCAGPKLAADDICRRCHEEDEWGATEWPWEKNG